MEKLPDDLIEIDNVPPDLVPVDEPVSRKRKLTSERVASHGTFTSPIMNPVKAFSEFKKKWDEGGVVGKGLSVLEAGATPFENVISGTMAPTTEFVRSIREDKRLADPVQMFKEFQSGLSGKKKYTLGDLYYAAGAPDPLAATMGFVGESIIPVGGAGKVSGKLASLIPPSLRRVSDKKVREAGVKLLLGAQEAARFVGNKLEQVYKPISQTPIDNSKLIGIIDKLPESVIEDIEDVMKINFADIKTIGQVRKMKQIIGDFVETPSTSTAVGSTVRKQGKDILSAYGQAKQIIRDALKSSNLGKYADTIDSADEAYSKVVNASKYIKKNIVDRTTKEPTKAGAFAGKVFKQEDITPRNVLQLLRKSGKTAEKQINESVRILNSLNNEKAWREFAAHASKAAIYGGVFGAVGGAALQKATGGAR